MQRMKPVSALLAFLCVLALNACQPAALNTQGPRVDNNAPPALPDDISAAVMPDPATAAPVKIGLLLPLSGEHAALGNAMLQAAQMALFDMGHAGFELVPRDTAGGAASAAQSIIDDKVALILGPVFAEDARAARPLAAKANINMIAFTTDSSVAGPNIFIMGFLPGDQIARVVSYAGTQGLHMIGVAAPRTNYGEAVVKAYNAAASRSGIRTAGQEFFAPDPHSIGEAAARLSANRPQAVLIAAGAGQAVSVSQALAQNGAAPDSVRRLGTGLFDDPALAKSGALENAWFAAPAPAARIDFEQRFQTLYGSAPPRLASLSYDATALAAVLARRGVFDRNAIINANGFTGIDGIFRFRADGLAERGLAVLGFRQGRIETIDPAPQTFQSAPY